MVNQLSQKNGWFDEHMRRSCAYFSSRSRRHVRNRQNAKSRSNPPL